MIKETYERAKLDLTVFKSADIITESLYSSGENATPNLGLGPRVNADPEMIGRRNSF